METPNPLTPTPTPAPAPAPAAAPVSVPEKTPTKPAHEMSFEEYLGHLRKSKGFAGAPPGPEQTKALHESWARRVSDALAKGLAVPEHVRKEIEMFTLEHKKRRRHKMMAWVNKNCKFAQIKKRRVCKYHSDWYEPEEIELIDTAQEECYDCQKNMEKRSPEPEVDLGPGDFPGWKMKRKPF